MSQRLEAWNYRNGNAWCSARAVIQEQYVFRARLQSWQTSFFGGLASVLDNAMHLRLLYEGGGGVA